MWTGSIAVFLSTVNRRRVSTESRKTRQITTADFTMSSRKLRWRLATQFGRARATEHREEGDQEMANNSNADANSDEDMHKYESDEGDQFASNLFL